jgi:hypothetical protein
MDSLIQHHNWDSHPSNCIFILTCTGCPVLGCSYEVRASLKPFVGLSFATSLNCVWVSTSNFDGFASPAFLNHLKAHRRKSPDRMKKNLLISTPRSHFTKTTFIGDLLHSLGGCPVFALRQTCVTWHAFYALSFPRLGGGHDVARKGRQARSKRMLQNDHRSAATVSVA